MVEGRSSPELLQESERGRHSTEKNAGEDQFLVFKGFTKCRILDILGVSR